MGEFLRRNFLVSVTWCPSFNPKAGLFQVPGTQAPGQPDVARVQERTSLPLRVSIQCCSVVTGAVIQGLDVVSPHLLPLNPPGALHEVGVEVELGFLCFFTGLHSVLALPP